MIRKNRRQDSEKFPSGQGWRVATGWLRNRVRILPIAICAVLIFAMISGCVSVHFGYPVGAGVVTGMGSSEVFPFDFGEITEIRVSLLCDIELYTEPSNTVTFEVQPNLMEYISVEEHGGVLTVRSSRSISQTGFKTPVLTVGTATLSKVSFAGAGTFTAHDTIATDSFMFELAGAGKAVADLDVDRLSIDVSGAGDIRLSGTADEASFNLAGAGRVEALSLQTHDAEVILAGAGTVRLSCSESLRINAGGVGTVEYRGSPAINISRGGLVSIQQID